jgi:hypothetical protein
MCPDCNGTGLIKTETIHFGRPYWKDGELFCDQIGLGNWSMTQCPCVGEEE